MDKKLLEDLDGKGLIIHHWDTDGICSACLILDHLSKKEIDNRIPTIGNYFLTENEIEECTNYDYIIILDISFPENNIKRLATNSKVLIFDHHISREIKEVYHINPIARGERSDKYPSTSWIVNSFLEKPINLYAILGIIGDHEERIKENKEVYKRIMEFCKRQSLSFDNLLKMVYLIDSNYKVKDREAVEKAPREILKMKSYFEILNNNKWNKNLEKINSEINNLLSQPNEEIGNLIYKKIDSPFNIISTVTRKIAWSTGKDVVVLNTGFSKDYDQIYVRSKKDVEPLIKKGIELGIKCGGKRDVMGAVVPKERTEEFLSKVIEFLNS